VSLKIIHILHHSPSWTSKNLDEDIFDGWHVRTAKAIQRLGIKDCKIECWLPEKIYPKQWQTEKDDIIYQTFPSHAINYGREISWSLMNAIKSESKNPILIHIHGIFNYTTYLISELFQDLPIVVQHHGDCPPLNLLQRRPLLYSILPLLQLEHFFFSKSLHNIDYFFCLTKSAQQSLHYLGIKDKSSIQGMGINFTEFTPTEKDKVRKSLNLPIETKILLYIGRLDRYKGSDKLITAYQKSKYKYDLCLVIVGAKESDEYYQQAIQSGAFISPRQSHKNLVKFYQAADIFVLPGSEQYNQWGGIGVNTIESLACNTPVITGTLTHFPQSINKIGVLASKSPDIISAVEYILKNYTEFSGCREIAQKYYDWQIIANNTYNIYEKLFRMYYNIKLEKVNV
jgi:glycosyltransferase involved in cell wall biosynthesis